MMSESSARNLWQVFEATVARHGARAALALPDRHISFDALQELAKRAAAWLVSLGLRRGDIVAIHLPKRVETYAIWLGCLRQGLPYVFVDPRNPADRTASILDRLRPGLLITAHDAHNPHGRQISVGEETDPRWLESLPSSASAPAPARVDGLDPAYVMFTSGSTGEPKGAVIPHQGILALMLWARNQVLPAGEVRVSNLNPLHFDNSVFDLYCGLLGGGTLVPVETGAISNPMGWVRRLRDARANVIFAVPTLFLTLDRLKLLTPDSLPDAKVFLFGGEGFPIEALRSFYARFRDRVRLINVYGPTETSCICSSIEIDQAQLDAAGAGYASLGRMHVGFEHLVLGPDNQPAETGELWIGGPCVGLGYFANPQETAQRFCQDPRQQNYRSIWYRTGDLVREDDQGLLWFQGRVDNQVKIRGHRIELEEIDLATEQKPGVLRASCVAVEGIDGLELRLAFIAEHAIPEAEMRAHLTDRLPVYMRPSVIRQIDQLPLNANGKVNRVALRPMMTDRQS